MKDPVRSFAALFAKEATACLLLSGAFLALGVSAKAQESASEKFNKKGNILISDQFNNRVIEIAPNGSIVRQFGDGSSIAGAGSFVAPDDITDQGNHRVIEVAQKKSIVWQQGQTGVAGSGFNQLNDPQSAELLANGNSIIEGKSCSDLGCICM